WSTVLPLIADAAPSLSKLALTDVETRSEADTFAFLVCLPRLTDLDVIHPHPSWGLGTHKTKGPIPHLVHLVHLRAPTTVVEHLLSCAHRFSAICTICVVWKPPRQADIVMIRHTSNIFAQTSTPVIPGYHKHTEPGGYLYSLGTIAFGITNQGLFKQ
ncbi:hypothetical protein B0H13DRAFT_1634736, partial [Mycena leptocephala]